MSNRSGDTLEKLKILKDIYTDEADLEQIVTKLFDVILSRFRSRLERYEHDLSDFENRYGIETPAFYRRFEAGELGDSADFFEWAGLYELRQNLVEKIRRLELAL